VPRIPLPRFQRPLVVFVIPPSHSWRLLLQRISGVVWRSVNRTITQAWNTDNWCKLLTSVTSVINHSTLEWYVGLTIRHTTPDIRCRHRRYDYDFIITYIRYCITDIKTSSSTHNYDFTQLRTICFHGAVDQQRETKYTTGDSCDGRMSVLNHSLPWSKFVNTHLYHSRQWFNIYLSRSHLGPLRLPRMTEIWLWLICIDQQASLRLSDRMWSSHLHLRRHRGSFQLRPGSSQSNVSLYRTAWREACLRRDWLYACTEHCVVYTVQYCEQRFVLATVVATVAATHLSPVDHTEYVLKSTLQH